MSPNDWSALEPHLDACLELDDRARDAYLRERCPADVRAEVRQLLDRERTAAASGFLEPPGLAAPPDRAGERLGPWELESFLGEGGMGAVWLGRRADGSFEKRVAVKFLKLGLRQPAHERRFRREVEILARLDHPSIVRLLDAGRTGDGAPYVVLEYVDGRPVDAWCDEHGADLDARLASFLRVLDAVGHAHEAGVVHRDLKPSNVLIDAAGVPRLLDFGIAGVLDEAGEGAALDPTSTGLRPYSPLYASPEQVHGLATGPTSEVFSLGVLLFELLVGGSPWEAAETGGLHALERRIAEGPAARASTTALRVARERPTLAARRGFPDADAHARALAGDLDAILSVALRPDPAERYATVAAFADDLRRHRAGRAVVARPEGRTRRVRRWVARRREAVVVTLVAALAIAALGASLAAVRGRARDADRVARHAAAYAALEGAAGALAQWNSPDARARLDAVRPADRGWLWQHLDGRVDASAARLPFERSVDLAVDVAGGTAAVLDARGAHLVELEPLRIVADTCAEERGTAVAVDGRTLLVGTEDGRLLMARPDGTVDERRLSDHALRALAPSRSPALLAWSDEFGTVGVLDRALDVELFRAHAHDRGEVALALSPDGRHLATAGWDERLQVWDVARGERLALDASHDRQLTDVAWTEDGTRVLCTSLRGYVVDWRWSEETAGRRLPVHSGVARGLTCLADGARVASLGGRGDLLVWDLADGRVHARLPGNDSGALRVRYDARTGRLLTLDASTLRVFAPDAEDVPVRELCEYTERLVPHPRLDRAATAGPDGRVRVWDADGRLLATERWTTDAERFVGCRLAVAWDGDELLVASVRAEGVELRHLGAYAPLATIPTGEDPHDRNPFLSTIPGREDVVLGYAGVHLLERRDGALVVARSFAAGSSIEALATAPDGDELCAAMDRGRVVRAALPSDGASVSEHRLHAPVEALAYLADGRIVASLRNGPLVEVPTRADGRSDGRRPRELLEDGGRAFTVHPRSGELVIGCADGGLEVLDLELPDFVVRLAGHPSAVGALAFGHAGRTLWSIGEVDGSLRIWSAGP